MTVCAARPLAARACVWLGRDAIGLYLPQCSGSAVLCVGMWSSELSADVVRTVVLRRPLKVGTYLRAYPTGWADHSLSARRSRPPTLERRIGSRRDSAVVFAALRALPAVAAQYK